MFTHRFVQKALLAFLSSLILFQTLGTSVVLAQESFIVPENTSITSQPDVDEDTGSGSSEDNFVITETDKSRQNSQQSSAETSSGPVISKTEQNTDSQPDEAKEIEFEYTTQSAEIEDTTITIMGDVPQEAELSAVEISGTSAIKNAISDYIQEDIIILDAFDISIIQADGQEYEPADYNKDITLQLENSDYALRSDIHIFHIQDDGTIEEVFINKQEEQLVEVTAEQFSTYVVGTTEHDSDTTSYLKTGIEFNEAIKQLVNPLATYDTEDTAIRSIRWVNETFVSDIELQAEGAPVYARAATDDVSVGRKYSHTSNINDQGAKSSIYSNNLATKEVITIPGATKLHITLTYGTEKNYDYVYVFQGEYTGAVTRNMSKGQVGTYDGGSNTTTTIELDIPGDTATFAFYSDSSSSYYGYYAIAEGFAPSDEINGIELYTTATDIYANEDCSHMFESFSNLSSITCFDNINTLHTTNYDAFCKNNLLQSLDMSTWDLSAGSSFVNMLLGCDNLQIINAASIINGTILLPAAPGTSWYIDDNADLTADLKNPQEQLSENHCYIRDDIDGFSLYTTSRLINGKTFNQKIKALYSSSSSYTTINSAIKHITLTDTPFTSSTQLQESGLPLYAKYDSSTATILLYTEAEKIWFNPDSSYMFSNFTVLTDTNLPGSDKTIVNSVENFSYMFYKDAKLESLGQDSIGNEIGISQWNTNSATTFSHMFDECKVLTVDVSAFVTNSVTDLSYMFNNCTEIYTLDMSEWHVDHVTDLSYMLNGCINLERVYFSQWNTGNVTNFSHMMENCSSTHLTSLDLSNWTISAGAICDKAFVCSSVTSILAPKTIAEDVLMPLPYTNWNIDDNRDGLRDDATRYDVFKNGITDHSYYYIPGLWDFATLKTGKEFNIAIKRLISPSAKYTSSNNTITSIQWTDRDISNDSQTIRVEMEGAPVYAKLENTTVLLYTSVDLVYLNSDASSMFNSFEALQTLDFSEKFDTSLVTDMSSMFSSCSKLTTLVFGSNFDTSRVKNMSYMFARCSSLTTLDLNNNFDTSNVTNMCSMFTSCYALTSLDLGDKFDTSNVTNMGSMFSSCGKLTIITLGDKFNTSSVTSMSAVFSGCKSLTALNLGEEFDTSNATAMTKMFSHCESLTTLDLGNKFDTSNVTEMSNMFEWCTSLTTLNLGDKFDTSNVIYMSEMFSYCESLTALNLNNAFNTANVITMKSMFFYCKALTTLDLGDKFDTSNVKNMERMFDSCVMLATLNLGDKFNTEKVTTMFQMFNSCKALTTLDLGNKFDTSNVTNMGYMFFNCQALTTITLNDKFNTSKVTNMAYMFDSCRALTTLTLGEAFNTSNVTTTQYMFANCTSLTELDLSNWETSHIENCSYMFDYCSNLQQLNLTNWILSSNVNADMFILYCTNLQTLYAPKTIAEDVQIALPFGRPWQIVQNTDENASSVYSMLVNDIADCSYTYIKSDLDSTEEDYTILLPGSIFNTVLTRLYQADTGYYTNQTIQWTNDDISNDPKAITIQAQGTYLYALCSKSTIYLYTTASTIYLNPNSAKMFYNRTDKTVAGFFQDPRINTSLLTDTHEMFCMSGVQSLDLHNFDTSNVTDMHNMFSGCSSLTALDISNFNTSNVTDFSGMFDGCRKLVQINAGVLDTSHATNLARMFQNCTLVTSLDVSHFNTSYVTDMSNMFNACTSLESIDISYFDTSNVTSMENMFLNCTALNAVDIKNFNTTSLVNTNSMFKNCQLLTDIDISKWDASYISSCEYMFSGCTSLVGGMDISSFGINTTYHRVLSCKGIFLNCPNLTNIKMCPATHNFQNARRRDSSEYYYFYNCSSLNSITIPAQADVLSFELPSNSWYLDDNGDGIPDSTTPYAKIIEKTDVAHTYIKGTLNTISFCIINGDETISNQTFDADDITATITDPIILRRGYTLNRWYTDAACTQLYDMDAIVTSSFTLYAKWEKQRFTITFDPNGGTLSNPAEATRSVIYGDIYGPLPVATKDDMYFAGWYTPDGAKITRRNTCLLSGDVTLTARWSTEEVKYTATFVSNGGNEIAPVTSLAFSSIDAPTCTRNNHILSGWYTDRAFEQKWNFNTDVLEDDITLYAKWQQSVCTVIFDSNGGSNVTAKQVNYNNTVSAPTEPTRDTFIFKGWKLGNELYDFSTPVTSDITLTAVWEDAYYTVSVPAMIALTDDYSKNITVFTTGDPSKSNIMEATTVYGYLPVIISGHFGDHTTLQMHTHWSLYDSDVDAEFSGELHQLTAEENDILLQIIDGASITAEYTDDSFATPAECTLSIADLPDTDAQVQISYLMSTPLPEYGKTYEGQAILAWTLK